MELNGSLKLTGPMELDAIAKAKSTPTIDRRVRDAAFSVLSIASHGWCLVRPNRTASHMRDDMFGSFVNDKSLRVKSVG